LPLFAGKESSATALNQQGRQRVVTAEEFIGIASFVPGFEAERKRSARQAMRVEFVGAKRVAFDYFRLRD
jgi:hypothetical protein